MKIGSIDFQGDLDLNGNDILDVADPTTDQGAATKKYSDDNLPSTDTLKDNILMNAFRISINGSLVKYNMIDGIMDEFEDESGVDTGTSTNEDYDSENDLYSPTDTGAIDEIPEMTSATEPSGDVTKSNELGANYAAWQAFNNAVGDTEGWVTAKDSTTGWIQYHFDIAKTIVKYTMQDNNESQTDRSPNDWTFEASNTGAFGGEEVILDTQTNITWTNGEKKEYSFENTTAYSYYRIVITQNNGDPEYMGIGEIEMMIAVVTDNMTLISETFVADSAPDDARIIIFQEDVDVITLNTDIKAYVSRDDGANYTQITLTDEGNYSGSKRILSGTADISGQAEDTDMVYKIQTFNEKDQEIHAIGLTWD